MNNNFLCHIIRDIFPKKNSVVIYSDIEYAVSLKKDMASSEHSIGSFVLHTDRNHQEYIDEVAYWEIGLNSPYMGYNYSDLFLSINYSPKVYLDNNNYIAEQIRAIMKPSGNIFLINPGTWASELSDFLNHNDDLVRGVKKYSMLKNENVFVYENI
jgi:hypothetical protein